MVVHCTSAGLLDAAEVVAAPHGEGAAFVGEGLQYLADAVGVGDAVVPGNAVVKQGGAVIVGADEHGAVVGDGGQGIVDGR